MKMKFFAAAIALCAVSSTWAGDKGQCLQFKDRAKVLQVADMSQQIQFPVLGQSGEVVALQAYSKKQYKVTLRGIAGVDYVVLLPDRPAGDVVETSIEVCPADSASSTERYEQENSWKISPPMPLNEKSPTPGIN